MFFTLDKFIMMLGGIQVTSDVIAELFSVKSRSTVSDTELA